MNESREAELVKALRELLKAGTHDGPCDNEDSDDACELHLAAYTERRARAEALLTRVAIP